MAKNQRAIKLIGVIANPCLMLIVLTIFVFNDQITQLLGIVLLAVA